MMIHGPHSTGKILGFRPNPERGFVPCRVPAAPEVFRLRFEDGALRLNNYKKGV